MTRTRKRAATEDSAQKPAAKRTRHGASSSKPTDQSGLSREEVLTRRRAKQQGTDPLPAEADPERLLRQRREEADRREAREMERRGGQGPSAEQARMSRGAFSPPLLARPPFLAQPQITSSNPRPQERNEDEDLGLHAHR